MNKQEQTKELEIPTDINELLLYLEVKGIAK